MDVPSSTAGDSEPGPRKKRKCGSRCNAGGCSNTIFDGFFVHRMPGSMPVEPGERFTGTQKSWIEFIKRKRKFEAKSYKHINLCSGHFVEADYVYTEVQMYKHGIRKKSPNLKKDAFPTVIVAEHPFPPKWFVPAPTMQQSGAICASPLGGHGGEAPTSSTSPPSQADQGASSISEVHIHGLAEEEPELDAGSGMRQTKSLATGGGKRKMSALVRRKEIHAICTEYEEKVDEEKRKEMERDILDRSKGEQCSVKMVHHRVGIGKGQRSCKVQVKPKTSSRGTQVNIYSKPDTASLVQYCDAASQTTESKPMTEQQEEDDHDDDDDDVFGDDERKDPTYDPLDSPDEEVQDVDQPTNIWEESKYIVFETQLLALFQVCRNCLSQSVDIQKVRPKCYGSQLKIIATCQRCSHVYDWYSQPKVGNVMAGNLLLSAAILYGGASPTKVLRVLNHMNLKVISNQTFLDHQKEYLQPSIIRVAQRQQHQLLNRIKPGEKLIIGGDGRSDSPGHSAKFGSYTFMDMKTKKVIDVQLVQSNEVKSSNAMEKEGLSRGLANLYSKGLVVGTLITDRHAQVAKWIRENYPEIDHRYDVWHIAKGIQKKILVVAKLKDCELAGKWKPAIVNHVYWSAMSTPDGDGELMVAKFRSIENHIRNIHEEHSAIFPKCEHSEDYPQREWMKEGTKVYEKLMQEVMKTRFLNDMKKMSPLEQTSSVEAFHSVLLYWCPKMLAFSHSGMLCRLYLAQMHWNENADRTQALTTDGMPMYKITFPKAKAGGHTVSRVLTTCTFNYVEELMEETIQLVSRKQKLRPQMAELQGKPALCSEFQHPDKAEAVRQLEAHRRFAKQ
ncbi:uncharacterized protein LOC121415701 [Lytechinus variegatus]|uniref:uncharacterized protein LOC121415701 n=1 Tax=Lytechinus variegatus TaxID=7654 RepID=UPI001BB2C5F7|nr:uncharacterized protein LOC121415701 [Lytechinus variegatus]